MEDSSKVPRIFVQTGKVKLMLRYTINSDVNDLRFRRGENMF